MDADDHAHIDLVARLDDHRAAVFQVEHRVGNSLAGHVGQENAVGAAADIALVGLVAVEQAVHHGGAAGVGEKFRLVADQAACRCVEHQADAIAAGRTQFGHLGLALGHLLDDDAGMFLINVDDDFLDRLHQGAALVLVHDDARTRHGKLKAFAAHGLDQDGELQFATARDVERILAFRLFDLQRHIAFGFLEQAVADDAACHLVALGAGQRRVIDQEGHGHGRRVDRLGGQRLGDGRITERVCHGALGEACNGDDVAGMGFLDRLALEAAEGEDLGDAAVFDQLAVAVEDLDGLVRLDRTGMDAAGDDAAEERVGFQDRADHAERAFGNGRLGAVLENQVEQRGQ